MAKGKGKSKGKRRHDRDSRPATPDSFSSMANNPPQSPVQFEDEDSQGDRLIVLDQTFEPFFQRMHTALSPTTRPAPPNPPPHHQATPTKKSKRKRDAEPVSHAEAPQPKKPASKSTHSDLAPNDVALARRPKMNEVTGSSTTGQEHSPTTGEIKTHAPGMGKPLAFAIRKQASALEMSSFKHDDDENLTLTRKPVTRILAAQSQPGCDSHGTRRSSKVSLRAEVPNPACQGCGSRLHITKNCHVPSVDGTVTICPFHDCSARNQEQHGWEGHSLDSLASPDEMDSNKPLHCPLIVSYRKAVEAQDRNMMKYMLPQLFGELVLGRKRKPCCRVFNAEVDPISIAIEFSREFCQGQMPSGLQGIWPYTLRDAKHPAILDKLQQYDEIGWQGMPPGELEAKSWEQIKDEYTRGVIPAQTFTPMRGRKSNQYRPPGAGRKTNMGGHDAGQPGRDTCLAEQSREQNSCSEKAREEAHTVQLLTENMALRHQIVRMAAKMDEMAETLHGLEGRGRDAEIKTKQGVGALGTRNDPIDVETNRGSIRWYLG